MELAVFDFDGTITRKDTFIEFIKFSKGRLSFFTGFVLLSPILILYRLKIIPNYRAKEIVLQYFFKGISKEKFIDLGKSFCSKKLPALIREKALEKISFHHKNNHKLIIISASPCEWIKPWAEPLGFTVIGTELEVIDGKLTGKICGKNCFGPEKVKRLKDNIKVSDYSLIYGYGDSSGDKELLAFVHQGFFKPFH
ncbi:MAG: HAD family hydrolase [Cytophagaceae bacterium]